EAIKKLDKLKESDADETFSVFRKILYCTMLDTLAKAVYPNLKNKSKARFINFIEKYCFDTTWEEDYWKKISIPQLLYGTEIKKLTEYAKKNICTSNGSDCDEIKRERTILEIESTLKLSDDDKKELMNFTHSNLLYKYRCTLIHEMKEPGHPWDCDKDDYPLYFPAPHIRTEEDTRELVYPVGFFAILCDTGIKNSKEYFIENKKFPYDSFDFGNSWCKR
ncbi:MAG: hypothetical protein GY710_03400, partial [Desulfobacteraceae bacterium]|nr:hypothetical protein [Desulfobacteraceae bacterium]